MADAGVKAHLGQKGRVRLIARQHFIQPPAQNALVLFIPDALALSIPARERDRNLALPRQPPHDAAGARSRKPESGHGRAMGFKARFRQGACASLSTDPTFCYSF
jgi:hypothetical protein